MVGACLPAQSKYSKQALQPILCAPPRVEDLSYLRSSKKSDRHPYHPARVGEYYQATLPPWEGPAISSKEPPPAAVGSAGSGELLLPRATTSPTTTEQCVGTEGTELAAAASTGTRATLAEMTMAAVPHGAARVPVLAALASAMPPGGCVLARDVAASAPVTGIPATIASAIERPVLARSASSPSSAVLPFALVVPRGKAAKQAAAAAEEERRWAATIASAEATELEIEAPPPPPPPVRTGGPSKPASPARARLGVDCSSSSRRRKRARAERQSSPCFDVSNLA